MFRISLRINPILIILALLIGYQLYGIAGALLALPIAAVIRQTVVYLRRHLVLEPWGTLGSGVTPNVGVDRCPGLRRVRAAPAMPTAARAAPRSSPGADARIAPGIRTTSAPEGRGDPRASLGRALSTARKRRSRRPRWPSAG